VKKNIHRSLKGRRSKIRWGKEGEEKWEGERVEGSKRFASLAWGRVNAPDYKHHSNI